MVNITEQGIQTKKGREGQGQEAKPEPCHPLKSCTEMHTNPFPRGTVGTENPEPLEPFHARAVTEPKSGLSVTRNSRNLKSVVYTSGRN